MVLGAYLIVFWFGLVVWTVQDVRHRSRDWLVRILAILMVLVFSIPGLIVYLIIRPSETLAVTDARALEAEALLQGMEEIQTCPHCKERVQDEFAVCPYCGVALKRQCVSCDRLLALNWTVCPYCATPVSQAQPAMELLPVPAIEEAAAAPVAEAPAPLELAEGEADETTAEEQLATPAV